MTTAVDRFKMVLASYIERVCVLEEQLEVAQATITELENRVNNNESTEDPIHQPGGDGVEKR